MSARDVIAAEFGRMHQSVCYPTASDGEKEWAGDSILAALTAAGYRIVPPGGLDAAGLASRLEIIGRERSQSEPASDPAHHMNVYARLSREDGALMLEAAAALRSLIEEPTNDAR